MLKKGESQKLNIVAEFHLVAHVNAGVDVEEMLNKHTEWIGEPKNDDGCIIAMRLKGWRKSNEQPKHDSSEKNDSTKGSGYSKCSTKECPFHGKSDVCKYPDNCRKKT